ncbi:transcriptional regulator, DeoR family [Spirochaeta thermophila DSM 6578]|uniref:Transcriptional regulator, DeoR family n=1 Tax=Winmispira thermophila (strain ATCC 700085 / DSM 6578 / Z-1203) TaxID=869211 RepID=G0GF54_WINT7|nr:DeoR/GlpR family DNA-binding transcription regulator [Spirochaeta thermophila]AEJ60753.1 transcriptional regulator, DeoR family [Spirochaeta thermophila DSM 6578]
MLAEERRRKILELIRENGSVKVSELGKLFRVSEPTIRQDLYKLEKSGAVVRCHGGAYLKTLPESVQTLSLEHKENMELKARIGRKAAEFVEPNSTIILDSGTTVTELAKNIIHIQGLRVITNALNIALLLGVEPTIEIHMTGGEFKRPTLSLTGEKAASFFDNMHADRLFLAAAGVSLREGLTYPGISDLPVKRAMIESSDEVFLLVDSTKIHKHAFAAINVLDQIDYLITDEGISEKDRSEFEKLGIKVIIAESDDPSSRSGMGSGGGSLFPST